MSRQSYFYLTAGLHRSVTRWVGIRGYSTVPPSLRKIIDRRFYITLIVCFSIADVIEYYKARLCIVMYVI